MAASRVTLRRRSASIVVLAAALVVAVAADGLAQTAENVAVVVNENSPASQSVADYYVRKRGIPAGNVFRIKTSVEDSITRAAYVASIEAPVAAAISRGGLQDRILYLVLTKGIPLRIEGTTGQNGTIASVDSELTLLYRRLFGAAPPTLGRVDNPYFEGARTDFIPFTRRDHDIYLVTRLDGFTVEDVHALIDRGAAPSREGRVVLDQQDRLVNRRGEEWLSEAAERLRGDGHEDRVVLESTIEPARGATGVLGYYSWGSNDPRNRARPFGIGFVPGALAAMFESSDARTFREPPAKWVPSASAARAAWHEGSAHALIGDLVREGVTGVAGNIAEPLLQSAIRPEVLFPSYFAGANLAEAFYRAMPHLGWQTVVVGDPLCAPFRQSPIDRAAIHAGIDAVTMLPTYFSKRSVAQLVAESPGSTERAAAQYLRGMALQARRETVGARQLFEEAASLSPQLTPAHFQLAQMHEAAGEIDQAVERYRRVVAQQPRNAVALNNLAYRLSVDRKSPREAMPHALAAVKLAPQNPVVLDTLAWIYHLLGDRDAAVKTMAAALKAAPAQAEIRLHAAFIYHASGARAVAQDNLREALKLDPALERRADVVELRDGLARR